MKEFKINEFITLKLEEEVIIEEEGITETNTNIYVKGEKFRQCSFLLINVPVEIPTPLREIESIDEAEERLDTSMEEENVIYDGNRFIGQRIPPETEFWGHCSNLQVWVENSYDTRLIHRNLAFPLLKKLTEVGDPIAKRVFKEEIAKRFASCHLSVVHFLLFGDYLDYLSEEELEVLFSEIKSRNKLLFLYIKPILMIKGKFTHDLTVEGFQKYLNKFNSDVEAGIFDELETYESFELQHGHSILDWLSENIYKKKN